MIHFGGLKRNSFISILDIEQDNQIIPDDDTEIFRHSPYFDNDKLIKELKGKPNSFDIISFNCESINAKFDQLNIYINLFASNGCEFHAICLQETWLSSDADTSLLELEGYTLISKGKHISERGGLIIYLKDSIKFKIIDIYKVSDIWEGQFIEIYSDNQYDKTLILGNIYRLSRNLNQNYQQFTKEPFISGSK